MTKWYDSPDAKHWLINELTSNDIALMEKILADKEWLQWAAACVTVYEGHWPSSVSERHFREILTTLEEKIHAATFLVFKKNSSPDKSKKLLVSLIYKTVFGSEEISESYFKSVEALTNDYISMVSAICSLIDLGRLRPEPNVQRTIEKILESPIQTYRTAIQYLETLGISPNNQENKAKTAILPRPSASSSTSNFCKNLHKTKTPEIKKEK